MFVPFMKAKEATFGCKNSQMAEPVAKFICKGREWPSMYIISLWLYVQYLNDSKWQVYWPESLMIHDIIMLPPYVQRTGMKDSIGFSTGKPKMNSYSMESPTATYRYWMCWNWKWCKLQTYNILCVSLPCKNENVITPILISVPWCPHSYI